MNYYLNNKKMSLI
jgi:membrane associated rhomboid family serine protease